MKSGRGGKKRLEKRQEKRWDERPISIQGKKTKKKRTVYDWGESQKNEGAKDRGGERGGAQLLGPMGD